jgi:putative Mg2+ transporter-C (MgtC) family protein
MDIIDFTIRLFAAIAGGLFIGLERQWHNKAAGLRTNTLVAGGAALYVLLSINITNQESGDVTRIIGQVVTGIGFIGAGIIFKEGLNVKGLTTAATVWCSSAIGSIAAGGYFYEAAIGVVAIIFINSLLMPVDRWFYKRHSRQHYDE